MKNRSYYYPQSEFVYKSVYRKWKILGIIFMVLSFLLFVEYINECRKTVILYDIILTLNQGLKQSKGIR